VASNPLDGVDLSGFLHPGKGKEQQWLDTLVQRTRQRASKFRPLTIPQKLAYFASRGYRPHGLYYPDDPEWADALRTQVREIGQIADTDVRLAAYFRLQDETEAIEARGTLGAWSGQQAITRSLAPFRWAGWSRRGGKSTQAAMEIMAIAETTPGARIWIAGPSHVAVSRVWDMMVSLVRAYGLETYRFRDSAVDRYLQLAKTGSIVEGISLANAMSQDSTEGYGASVDFVVIDEAARVSRLAMDRVIYPPLTDREGHLFVISAYEGESGYFYQQLQEAKRNGDTQTWQVFVGDTFENFFAFPLGRDSPYIQIMRRTMSTDDYLEQFHGVPMRARHLVYPQYLDPVHRVPLAIDPALPIDLFVDPSAGANPYAVGAIQDVGPRQHVLAEFYAAGASASHAMQWVNRQPWRAQVHDVVIDSAAPDEIEAWLRGGFKRAYGVSNKPRNDDDERYPLIRTMLRDPALFYPLEQRYLAQILDAHHLDLAAFEASPPDIQREISLELSVLFVEANLTPAMILEMRGCAHLLLDRRCAYLADELRHYAYAQRRNAEMNVREAARASRDHLIDGLTYWTWTKKRWDYLPALQRHRDTTPITGRSYIVTEDATDTLPEGAQVVLAPKPTFQPWLASVRHLYIPERRKHSHIVDR